jgi:hypothetical protein
MVSRPPRWGCRRSEPGGAQPEHGIRAQDCGRNSIVAEHPGSHPGCSCCGEPGRASLCRYMPRRKPRSYTRDKLIGHKIEMLVPDRQRGQQIYIASTFTQQPKIRRMGCGLDPGTSAIASALRRNCARSARATLVLFHRDCQQLCAADHVVQRGCRCFVDAGFSADDHFLIAAHALHHIHH